LSEYVYIKFDWDNFGYQAGDVVKAELNKRDDKGVHVTMFDNRPEDLGALINAWSDFGSFHEISEMEVLAHAYTGKVLL
jgi:hypothetical protein